MEWKVRALDDEGNPIEPKQESVQETVQDTVQEQVQSENTVQETVQNEVEQDNVSQQEEVVNEQVEEQAQDVQEEKQELEKPFELDDNSILNYLRERRNIEVESLDVLLNNEQKQSDELPEDVAKFIEYKKETGRSFDDYAKLQQDWSSVDDTTVLRQYYAEKKPHLDSSEIDYLITEQFGYDSEMDDEKVVKSKQIAYKEELYNARGYFEGMKEKYKAPLESRSAEIPEDYKEAFNFYNQYRDSSEQEALNSAKRAETFKQKTDSFFNNDTFKGFEFNVGDKKQVFKPSDVQRVKEVQSSIDNFFDKHLDENGMLKDAASYHKDMFAAYNADAIAKFFYEQGKADATDGIVKETKNIDMTVRENTVTDSSGTKFRVLDSGDDFSTFKIRKK